MSVQVKCAFCNRLFDFDESGGTLLAACPNCGRQNTVARPSGTVPHLHVRRDAPTLAGGKPCPRCQAMLAPDAVACHHCGFVFAGRHWARGLPLLRAAWLLIGLAGLLVVGTIAFNRWRLPAKTAAVPPAPPAQTAPAETPAVPAAIPSADDHPVPPVVETPSPPPDDDHARLEAQKALAEKAFRSRLDETMPLYQNQDQVELRLKTGRIIHGTLVLAGRGTNRVAVLETDEGKSIIGYADMDRDSRLRLDIKYREQYTRRMLRLPPEDPSMDSPDHSLE